MRKELPVFLDVLAVSAVIQLDLAHHLPFLVQAYRPHLRQVETPMP